MAEKEYRRLSYSRRSAGFGVASMSMALWMGRDHLLLIDTARYSFSESYKRFYYRDIQAIIIRRTRQRMAGNIVLGTIVGLLGLIAIGVGTSAHGDSGMLAGCGVVGGIGVLFLIILLVNTLMGPTVKCQLRTAVQTEELPIYRLRRAYKVLARVRPLITEAQGSIPPEELEERLTQMSAGGPVLVTPPAAPAAS